MYSNPNAAHYSAPRGRQYPHLAALSGGNAGAPQSLGVASIMGHQVASLPQQSPMLAAPQIPRPPAMQPRGTGTGASSLPTTGHVTGLPPVGAHQPLGQARPFAQRHSPEAASHLTQGQGASRIDSSLVPRPKVGPSLPVTYLTAGDSQYGESGVPICAPPPAWSRFVAVDNGKPLQVGITDETPVG
jgi:hypothetical protein